MEGRSLSPRVASELLERFKRQKVAISHAIKTTFPFLEGLRDKYFITNKMYEDFQDSCRLLVPVQKVIYRALDELEKKLDVEFFHELFSVVNLEKYPDLRDICRSFENVLPDGFFSYRRNGGDPNSPLRLEQDPSGSCSQRSLTWSPLDPSSSEGCRSNDRRNSILTQGNQTENYQLSKSPSHLVLNLSEDGPSEDLGENVHISRVRRDAPTNMGNNTNGPERKSAILPRGPDSVPEDSWELQVQLNNRDATPESRSLLPRNEERAVQLNDEFQISPCSVTLVDIKTENPSFSLHGNQQTRARIIQNEDSEVIELHSDDSDGGENFSEASTSVPSQPAPGYVRQPPRQRPYSRGALGYIRQPPRRRPYSRGGPRIPRDDNADFGGAELPVTCGSAEGTLHKEKLKQGIYEKSIKSQTGRWLTPTEFEIEGNRERSRNWRLSIRCKGRTLGELIKKGVLQDPPRKKLGNPKTCKVCRKPRKLYPCATCRKFYHKNCHIPPVEDKSSPWHCAFCKRNKQLRCQNTQECHKEAVVLKRKMTPEEQLKCELLLLIIYCYPKSAFFIRKPKQRKEDFPDLQEHMWLNKIKNWLNKKEYRLVQHFVEDMRLIFQNHRIFYKKRFKNLGIRVGNKFEKTFKMIFSIEDTSNQHAPV